MTEKYDLIAIGTGVAASKVAQTCKAAGWRAAVVDSGPYGGTCLLRGCDPKKLLWGVAATVDQARLYQHHGVHADSLSLSWSDLIRFKQAFLSPEPAAVEHGFEQAGIDTLHGRARFVGRNQVTINGGVVEGEHIVIAAGSKPRPLPISGAEHLLTSDDVLDLQRLPETVAFVGGGYVSFELAHVAAQAGAKVTILHENDHPLGHFDHGFVRRLLDKSGRQGVEVLLNSPVGAIEKTNRGFVVTFGRDDAAQAKIEADAVVHGAGRIPDLEDLDLRAGGLELEHDGHHLRLTPELQSSSNPAVYAAGDAAETAPMLTPVAELEGEVVAHNLLHPDQRMTPDYSGIPSAVFTIPVLASVGLTEEQAAQNGIAFDVHQADITSWYSARRLKADTAAYKVLVGKTDHKIVGAHLIGPGAEETINLFALAIRSGIDAEEMQHFVPAYPSEASNIGYMLA